MAGLAALGGIGRGISRGAKDIRDWEDERFRKTQRERLLKEQGEEDALKEELKGVRPEGEITETELGGDPREGVDPVIRRTTRTGEQVAREQAGIYQKRGKVAESTALRSHADTLKAKAQREGAMQQIQTVMQEYQPDPIGWAVKDYNANVKDGRLLVPMSVAGGKTMGVHVDQNTGEQYGTIPLSQELAEAALNARINSIMAGSNDTDLYFKSLDHGLALRRAAEETKRTAIAQETLGLNRQLIPAHAAYYNAAAEAQRAHADLYKRTDPNLRGAGGAGAAGRPFKMKVNLPDPANPGKRVATEVMVTFDPKTGDRKFLDATGRDVTNDPRFQTAIQGATEEAAIDEQHEMLLAEARKAYGKGEMDDATYDAKVLAIRQRQEYAKQAAAYRLASPEERTLMIDTLLENKDLTPKAVSKILGVSETVVNARRAELKQLGIKKKAEAKAEEQRILTAPRNPRPPVVPGEPQPETP